MASDSGETADYPAIAIIGAGFAGIGMAITLRRAGYGSITIYEKADRLGGTWRDNSYPGAGCDVPSHLYCYSFAPKPDWSRRYSPQAEILAYLEDCADRFDIRRHIRFSTEVTAASYAEDTARWSLTLDDGATVKSDILIASCGQLNRPLTPDLPGLDSFRGISFHSARWRHDIDLAGKRVGVIGTGASAVQIVPEIAREAASLTLFQRTPSWIIPRNDRHYARFTQWLFRTFPALNRLYRGWIYAILESRFPAFRKRAALSRLLSFVARRHLRRQVPDPDLRRKLTPDYPVGCKRILISDDFYPSLMRSHVQLETGAADSVTPDGVQTADGRHHALDVLIFATGFAATEFLAPIRIHGRHGQNLEDVWSRGARAWLGMTVPDFPNMFLLYGPNTNLGHNSIIFMLECQFDHIRRLIDALRARGGGSIAAPREQATAFDRATQDSLQNTVWAAGCASWYMTGDGRITNNWPGTTPAYRRLLRRTGPKAYDIRSAP